MAESCSRKLVVEVCHAKNLMPKDGQGTASAYVLVDFDSQRRRTKTKFRDLNPQWDEKIEFLVHDPDSMTSEALELNIYNDKKTGKAQQFPWESQDIRQQLPEIRFGVARLLPSGEKECVFAD